MGAKSHRMMKNPLRNRNPQQIHYCWLLLLLLWIAALHHVRAERDINLELQEELLKFLGMKRPLGNKEHRIPNYMQQMYNKNRQIFNTAEDLQRTPNYFNINNHGTLDNVRCLANITEVGNATEIRPGVARITIKFSFEGVPSEELLHSAQLRVTHSPRDFETEESRLNDVNHPNGVTSFMPPEFYPRKYKKDNLPYVNYLRVYDVVRVLDDDEQVLRLLDTTTVDRRNSGIITLDVGPAVSRWVKRPRTNHGLVLEMSPAPTQKKIHKYRGNALSHLRLKRNNHPADEEYWHDIKPSLLLRSDSGVPRVRKKRTANTQPYEKCQRHELYVDFEKVDWKSWIFAPRGYSAFYCAGACEFPLATHMNTTNHAIIQTLVNSKYPDRVPKSCCVPTEMSPISLLYKDDYESVTLKNYQNMVVEACGCR